MISPLPLLHSSSTNGACCLTAVSGSLIVSHCLPQARSSSSHSAQARIERITGSGLFRLVSDQALAKIQVGGPAAGHHQLHTTRTAYHAACLLVTNRQQKLYVWHL
jgi:hypothetical protein